MLKTKITSSKSYLKTAELTVLGKKAYAHALLHPT